MVACATGALACCTSVARVIDRRANAIRGRVWAAHPGSYLLLAMNAMCMLSSLDCHLLGRERITSFSVDPCCECRIRACWRLDHVRARFMICNRRARFMQKARRAAQRCPCVDPSDGVCFKSRPVVVMWCVCPCRPSSSMRHCFKDAPRPPSASSRPRGNLPRWTRLRCCASAKEPPARSRRDCVGLRACHAHQKCGRYGTYSLDPSASNLFALPECFRSRRHAFARSLGIKLCRRG